jgi:hypothetical protein
VGALGFCFFSFEGVSAPIHHLRVGEDAHVYGLIFAKSHFKGELVVH